MSLTVAAAVLSLVATACGSSPEASDESGTGEGRASDRRVSRDHERTRPPAPGTSAAPSASALGATTDAARQRRAAELVESMTLAERAGQLLMPVAYGRGAHTVTAAHAARNRDVAGVATPAAMVRRWHLGGLILLGRNSLNPTGDPSGNLDSPRQTARFVTGVQRAARAGRPGQPLLVGIDQEQGLVTRIGPPAAQFPGAMALGAAGSAELARKAAEVTGRDLRSLGITMNFAPDADVVTTGADNVIGERSFGSRPAAVSRLVRASVEGYRSAGVAAVAKHFPGHGGTDVDSHLALPVVERSRKQLARVDLAPFRAAIGADVPAVMLGHLVVPAVDRGTPAVLSRKVVTGLLRDKLGFDGVVVTDSLRMAAVADRHSPAEVAVRSVAAGADVLLDVPDVTAAHQALVRAVRSGRLPARVLADAATRVVALKLAQGAPAAQPQRLGDSGGGVARAVARAAMTQVARCGRSPLPLAKGTGVRIVTDDGDVRARFARALRRNGLTVSRSGDGVPVQLLGTGDAPQPARIAVAVGTPYTLADSPADLRLASYSDRPVALEAVAEVLAGRTKPTGSSPVPLPGDC